MIHKITEQERKKFTDDFCKLVADSCFYLSVSLHQFSRYYVPRELLLSFDERKKAFSDVVDEIYRVVNDYAKCKKFLKLK